MRGKTKVVKIFSFFDVVFVKFFLGLPQKNIMENIGPFVQIWF